MRTFSRLLPGELRQTDMQRFAKKIAVTVSSGCWEWQGQRFSNGYGRFEIWTPTRKVLLAHRVAYALFVGELSETSRVLHSCDNPGCVAPKHLRLGTAADNVQDMHAKNRGRYNADHPGTKLSEEDVKEIRRRRARGEKLAPIALDYGVCFQHISDICLGNKRLRAG